MLRQNSAYSKPALYKLAIAVAIYLNDEFLMTNVELRTNSINVLMLENYFKKHKYEHSSFRN